MSLQLDTHEAISDDYGAVSVMATEASREKKADWVTVSDNSDINKKLCNII